MTEAPKAQVTPNLLNAPDESGGRAPVSDRGGNTLNNDSSYNKDSMAAQTDQTDQNDVLADSGLEPEDIERFTTALLEADPQSPYAELATHQRHGLSVERLCLDVMTPAARLLGDDWVQDRRNFAEVTLGLSRMQQMLRTLSPSFVPKRPTRGAGRRVLLAVVPGDQHSFGLCMVEEFFRHSGWDVIARPSTDLADLIAVVSREELALIGLSISRNDLIEPLRSVIDQLRQHSLNPNVSILVGGRVILDSPEVAEQVGADGMAIDARAAIACAQKLIEASHQGTPLMSSSRKVQTNANAGV